MPYTIRKVAKGWALVRADGTVKQVAKSKENAKAAQRLLMGLEHGWKPTGSHKRRK